PRSLIVVLHVAQPAATPEIVTLSLHDALPIFTGDHAKSARTVRRIVQAALHLYREIGHKKTTVADIARISSMSSANIYRFLEARDRKSTRLNSSHVSISYAVLCLKKKNISYTH